MRGFLLASVAAAAMLLAATPALARPFETGIFDGSFNASDPAIRAAYLDDTKAAGATTVRINLNWRSVAPVAGTPGFVASDPADPAYRWESIDAAVRDAASRDLTVLLSVHSAPAWAEGGDRPPSAAPGSWKPDPNEFADFLRAASRRYSGTYPDPQAPVGSLPAVREWQLWNEPNLPAHLSPQWEVKKNRFSPAAPDHYRRLLNAGYGALKEVSPENLVVTAGTAPYGDPIEGGNRIQPAKFLRELLCVRGKKLRDAKCGTRASFDVLAHHPYGVRGPYSSAYWKDDVAVPDVKTLTGILRAAQRAENVEPRGKKPVWVTEISWDSSPPDPDGVPEEKHARWVAEAQYVLWRQHVERIYWFLVRDQLPQPSYGATYQSGLYLFDGRPKPAQRAFRFPFVVDSRGDRARAWGRTPIAGQVAIERKRGADWTPWRSVSPDSSGVFQLKLPRRGSGEWRAVAGQETSLPVRARNRR